MPGIRLRYQPANPGLTSVLVCREDLPDVLAEPRGTRMLGALVDEVSAGLDPYSRWLARFPQGRGSLAAAAQLPPDLVGAGHGMLGTLRAWAESRLGDRPSAMIDAAEFGAFWSTAAVKPKPISPVLSVEPSAPAGPSSIPANPPTCAVTR